MKSHKKSNKINSAETKASRCGTRHPDSVEAVSRCAERASGCNRLPAQEQRTERLKKLNKLILNPPFEENLGRSSPNEARNDDISIKRIKTQGIKRVKLKRI